MKLSIIVPAFNAGKFIRTAFDKLISVECEKEIIVVNDGSSDNTAEILNDYKESAIIINSEKNMGASHARNLGIEKATGDYISFFDVDDDFDINIYSKMLDKISKEEADICVCNYYEVYENGKNIKSKYKFDEFADKRIDGLKAYLLDKISPAPWDKIYKTSIVKDIKFDEKLTIGEDILFNLLAFYKAKNVAFVDEPLYYYKQNSLSIMHNISDKFLQYLNVSKQIPELILKDIKERYPVEFDYFECEMITRGIHAISLLCNKNIKKQCVALLKHYCSKANIKRVCKNKYSSNTTKIECYIIRLFGIRVHLALMPLYIKLRKRLRNSK